MSAESRRTRQRRDPMVRHLGVTVIEAALGIPSAEAFAWKDGDSRATQTDQAAEAALYGAFEIVAHVYGIDEARGWFIAENAGLAGLTPVAALRKGHGNDVLAAAQADSPYERVDLAALDRDGRLRVGVAGDWHGNSFWAQRSLERFAAQGVRTVLHAGDFGLWPGALGAKYVRRIAALCERFDISVYVTDGNHEDHERLSLAEPVDGLRWITDRVAFGERGHRWSWGDTSFLSLGGAPSVDCEARTEGRDWFPEEAITAGDASRAMVGGPVDVMLTHDAPSPAVRAVENVIAHNPQGWPADALAYARRGRDRLSEVFNAVQPRLLVHGHFHVSDRTTVRLSGAVKDTQIVSLACDQMAGNLAVLDIESLEVTTI